MKFEILVNSSLNVKKLNGKPNQKQLIQYNDIHYWKKVSVTPKTLFKLVSTGSSICGAIKENGTSEDCIKNVSSVCLDIDKGIESISRVTENEFIKKNACLVYQTASSTPEKPRLRVVFSLPTPVSSEHAKAILIKLHRFFSQDIEIDRSCTDPGRLYYGTTYKEAEFIADQTLSVDYVSENEIGDLLAEYNHKSALLDDEGSTDKLRDINSQIWEDLKPLENIDKFFETVFPNITNLGEIKDQAGDGLSQYRGNPTYRQSNSGKSFDITFKADKSIVWCDKGTNEGGSFVDFYYRYSKGNFEQGIDQGDHKTYWDTLKKIYASLEVFFDEKKFNQLSTNYKLEGLDIKGDILDCIDFTGKKPVIDDRAVINFFLANHNILYSFADKNYYLHENTHYKPYSSDKFLAYFSKWLESQFEDKENSIFRFTFSLRKIKNIFESIKQVLGHQLIYDKPLENDTGFINFENGVFSVDTKEIYPHDPGIIHLYVNPYKYEPTGANLLIFKELLTKLIPEDYIEDFIAWLSCAVAFKGSELQILLACYGDSGSGKTSITNAITNLITNKDLGVNETLSQSLTTNFLEVFGDKSTYGTSSLLYKKVVCFGELNNFSKLSNTEIGRFKEVVGNSKIDINYNIKYGAKGTSKLSTAFMLTCEDLPEIPIDDQGLLRRIFWVPFTKSAEDLSIQFNFLQDSNFLGGLLSDLLSLDIEANLQHLNSNEFKNKRFKAKDFLAGDDYVQFVSNWLIPDKSSSVTLSEMKSTYKVYMTSEEIESRITKAFLKRVLKAIEIVFDIKQKDCYSVKERKFNGIKLL